jgi:lipoprotein signal peptidase
VLINQKNKLMLDLIMYKIIVTSVGNMCDRTLNAFIVDILI